MTVLVYLGLHDGRGLITTHQVSGGAYTHIIGFEPDPEYFNIANSTIQSFFRRLPVKPRITLVNAAASTKNGKATLYLVKNRAASSLAPNKDKGALDGTMKVNCVALYDYLMNKSIPCIEHYVSDIQGSDFEVLQGMKPYIDKGAIGSMYVETHSDNTPQEYIGLENKLSSFKELLSDNYFIDTICGEYNPDTNALDKLDDNPDTLPREFDVLWKRK